MSETVIRGGLVIDGTGQPGKRLDVVIRDGRIAEISTDIAPGGRRVIDATGLIVAPGFIDIKTHSDWTLPLVPKGESKVRQGVTTEVVGHCGYSCAPALAGKVETLADYLSPSAPWLNLAETTFADYVTGYPPTSVNRVMLVGHNTLRLMAMGMADRPAEPAELDHMTTMLSDALSAGAFGMSSGLFTAPGSYAGSEELLALGRVLGRHGGPYFTHVRDEANDVFEAVQEAIDFGEACGVHVQIVHIKLSGTANWGAAPRLLEMLASARRRGVSIDCDNYPYTAASNPLKNLFPTWLQEGGIEEMLTRLGVREIRDRLRREVDANGLNNFGRIESWDDVRISISPDWPSHEGRTIGEIARERGADPFETALDYLSEDRGQTRVLVTSISEEDVRTLIRAPEVLVGSDGNSLAPYGITGQGRPHPRSYGTFARILGHYVRELGLLPLHTAVRKMTGGSAAALGLADRGILREGAWADVTVFDPHEIAERATYDDPHQYSVGVSHVLVNGETVIEAGQHTGRLPGMALRRSGDSPAIRSQG